MTPVQIRHSRSGILLAGLGLMLLQLMLTLIVNGGKYTSLIQWDAAWYREIAVQGYPAGTVEIQPGEQTLIAFFPAFSIWVRGFLQFLPLTPVVATAIASQVAAAGAWSYLLFVAAELGAGLWGSAALALVLLVHPGAFYLVSGYSESLFALALLGFVYWTLRWFREARFEWALLAVFHGGVMAATRYVGVPLVVFPLLLALVSRFACRGATVSSRRLLNSAALMSVASLWGFGAFLLFCHFRYGRWNIYWEANRLGWNVYLDPWKLFSWAYYRDVFPVGTLSEVSGRFLTLLTLGALLARARAIFHRAAEAPAAVALTLLGFLFLIETVVGSHGMHSMIRYLFPVHALLLPVLAPWAEKRSSFRLALAMGAGLLLLFALQARFIAQHSIGQWVS